MEEQVKLVCTPLVWEKDYLWEDQCVLSCYCSLPGFSGKGRAVKRLERHYRHFEQILRRWLEAYHARCCMLAAEALAASHPLPSYSVQVDYQVAFRDEQYLSLLVRVHSGGGVRCFPELWEISSGTPVNCRKLLPRTAQRKLRGRDCLLTEEGFLALDGDSSECIHPGPHTAPQK